MATLNDGLGFEEVAPASGTTLPAQSIYAVGSITATNQISGLNLFATGSFTGGRIIAANRISGLDIFATGSVDSPVFTSTGSMIGSRIVNADGTLWSVPHGSPGLFSALIQVGSIATGAGSTGTATFRRNYATANSYVVFLTLQSGIGAAGNGTPGTIGSTTAWTSGAFNNGRNTSGINIVGAASTVYDYLVVGI